MSVSSFICDCILKSSLNVECIIDIKELAVDLDQENAPKELQKLDLSLQGQVCQYQTFSLKLSGICPLTSERIVYTRIQENCDRDIGNLLLFFLPEIFARSPQSL